MTPGKLLIAQCLVEVARELEAVAALAESYKGLPHWPDLINDMRLAADLAKGWAVRIRSEP